MESGKPVRRHSESYLDDQRDLWWNTDYLKLLTRRWRPDAINSVLDVGSGVGHWTRALASVLPPATSFTGVDNEADWVREASERSTRQSDAQRFQFREGSAEDLPFPAERFDLVTCQTLLIHVTDVRRALREMLRVLRPGGLMVLCEPSNRANQLVGNSTQIKESAAARAARAAFYLTCHEGKIRLGEGDNAVGDLLPGYLSELPVEDMQVFLADKPAPLFPPYASHDQQVLREQTLAYIDQDMWVWDKTDTRRFFLAGGGEEKDFEAGWKARLAENDAVREALADGTFHTAGGLILYVVSCRKPA